MNTRRKTGSLPWVTPDGTLDLGVFPIDSLLKQALSPEIDQFRSGCVLLGSMAAGSRPEAGVYLVGLLRYYDSDLQRLEVVAEQLAHFRHDSSADALLAEIRRVRSSNTTRRYLDQVLRSLARLPRHLVAAGLEDLADDTSFSSKMRAKLRDVLESPQRGEGRPTPMRPPPVNE